jgi:hypothetical protein
VHLDSEEIVLRDANLWACGRAEEIVDSRLEVLALHKEIDVPVQQILRFERHHWIHCQAFLQTVGQLKKAEHRAFDRWSTLSRFDDETRREMPTIKVVVAVPRYDLNCALPILMIAMLIPESPKSMVALSSRSHLH